MSFKSNLILTSALVGGLCVATAASAQDQPPPNEAGMLDEVVVTAQKRSENLQDVPVAVTAFTSEQRDKLGVSTVQDFAAFTPGMSYSDQPSRVYLRGIGRTSNQRSTEPGVAIYYDGVYSVNAAAIATPALLVDTVEILRGPQGTLYGRNTNGGAINITSKRPASAFEGEIRQKFANYEVSETALTVSGPINDRVRYRATGVFNWQGAQFSENLARPNEPAGSYAEFQAQIEADVTDNLRVWAKYDYSYANEHQVGAAAFGPYDTTSDTLNGGITFNPLLGYDIANPTVADHRTFAQNTSPSIRAKTHTFTLQADWDLGFASLRYVGGYAKSDAHVTQDLDNSARVEPYIYTGPLSFACDPATNAGCIISPVDVYDVDTAPMAYSNELNLISPDGEKLSWILGLYQYYEESPFRADLHRPFDAALTALPNNPTGTYINVSGASRNLTLAAFGQVDYQLSDTLTLQAGLRYTYDEKEETSGLNALNFSGPISMLAFGAPAFALPVDPADTYKRDFDGVTGKVAVQWRPDESTNIFALVATGYKSGAIIDPTTQVVIPPEKLTDFEVGIKKDFGSALRVNLAAFYYDYKNMQVETTGPDPNVPGNFIPIFVSAPKARSFGFEVETVWNPTENWDFLLSYSYLDATIRDLKGVADQSIPADIRQPQDVSGNVLPQSPKHKVAVNAGYTWFFEPGSLRVGTSIAYTSKKYFDIFTTPTYLGKEHMEVDLRAIWTSADEKLTVIGYVANALDEEGANYVNLINGTAATSFQLNQPRTFGVEFQRRF